MYTSQRKERKRRNLKSILKKSLINLTLINQAPSRRTRWLALSNNFSEDNENNEELHHSNILD